MPLAVLQNTRLGLVYSMAEITARAVRYVLYMHMKKKPSLGLVF
jgi:hypothetical protein